MARAAPDRGNNGGVPDVLQRVRTPGQVIRDAASGIQRSLDRWAGRLEGHRGGRAAEALARVWAPLWWIGVTSLATATAWTAALVLHIANPVVPAAAALVTVTLSVSRSLKTGVSLLVGTALALLVAFGLYRLWGIHVWTVAVLVAISLAIGLIARLGPQGALQIPATALFTYVLGQQLTDEVILQRIVATLIGVVIGLLFSFIAHPERTDERLITSLAVLNERLGDLLVTMGQRCTEGATRRDAAEWLTASRELAADVAAAGKAIEESGLAGHFAVGAVRARGRALVAQHAVLLQATQHVSAIARGLFDATSGGRVVQTENLGSFLVSTGTVLNVHAEAMPRTIRRGGETPTGVMRAISDVETHRSRSVASIKDSDDTQELLLGGAIVTDLDRLVEGLMRTSREEPRDN